MKRKDLGLKELSERITALYNKYGDIPVGVYDSSCNPYRLISLNDKVDEYDPEYESPVCMEICKGEIEPSDSQWKLIENAAAFKKSEKDSGM